MPDDNDSCYVPGTKVPKTGIYVNPETGERAECVEGEPFPPTEDKNQCWELETPTNPDKRD